MKCELNTNQLLRTSFEAIKNIVDTVQIQCDNDGFRLNALDRGHITFVHLDLDESCFTEYQCSNPEKINIDTGEFMKVLKRSKSTDRVILETTDAELIIVFEGEAKRTFKIRLIDLDYDSPNMPLISYDTILTLPTSTLKEAAQDIKLYSTKLTFKVDSERLIITNNGDMGETIYEYIHGEKVASTAKATFSLEKIEEILKAERFSTQATIKVGDDRPLTLTYEPTGYDARLSFLLAPRIEQED